MWALLTYLPGAARLFSALSGWLMGRKWGTWLLFYLGGTIGMWLNKIVTFAGVAFVAQTYAAPAFLEKVTGPMLGLPPEWINLFALTKVDQAVSIIVSAVVVKLAMGIKVVKNPQSPNWTTTGATP